MKRLPGGTLLRRDGRDKRRKRIATSPVCTERSGSRHPLATSESVFSNRDLIKIIIDHIEPEAWNTTLRLTPVTYEVSSLLLRPSDYLASIPYRDMDDIITVTSASPIESFVHCLKDIRDDFERPFKIRRILFNAIRWQRSDMVRACLNTGTVPIEVIEGILDPGRSRKGELPLTIEIVGEISRVIGNSGRLLEILYQRTIPIGAIFRTRCVCDLLDREDDELRIVYDGWEHYPHIIAETTWYSQTFSDLGRTKKYVSSLEVNLHTWIQVDQKLLHLWNCLLNNGINVETIFDLFHQKESVLYLVRVVMEQGFKMAVVRQKRSWLITLEKILVWARQCEELKQRIVNRLPVRKTFENVYHPILFLLEEAANNVSMAVDEDRYSRIYNYLKLGRQ